MSDKEAELSPVEGLVDNRRAAAILGISTSTFRVWATRAKTAKSGIAASMPKPVATMYGNVYEVGDIEDFGRRIAATTRAPRDEKRSKGQYYTPDTATDFMVRWALRNPDDSIFEPSAGDGQFVRAIKNFADELNWSSITLHACELDPNAAGNIVKSGLVDSSNIHIGDYLELTDLPSANVVIGNPPYVRIRDLNPHAKKVAMRSAEQTVGRKMDSAGSVWMPFVSRACRQLISGGRMAFVLPLDFTYVRYARPLWELLGKSFGKLSVVRTRERIFPEIMQNVVILLAEDKGGSTSTIAYYPLDRVDQVPEALSTPSHTVHLADILAGHRPFQFQLLDLDTIKVLEHLRGDSERADNRVKFGIGYVSGNKKYFQPSGATIEQFGLPERSLLPTVETSRQLAKLGLCTDSVEAPAKLWLPEEELSVEEEQYVRFGEDQAIDMGYKCRIRTPWYKVPGVRIADFFLSAFSDRPRLHLNTGQWAASNSVLCGYARTEFNRLGLISSWYTPLTLLSTELQVHALGGGVMIAVPSEADSILTLKESSTLAVNQKRIDDSLKTNRVDDAYMVGEGSIRNLVGAEGVDLLVRGAETLKRWRKSQA